MKEIVEGIYSVSLLEDSSSDSDSSSSESSVSSDSESSDSDSEDSVEVNKSPNLHLLYRVIKVSQKRQRIG